VVLIGSLFFVKYQGYKGSTSISALLEEEEDGHKEKGFKRMEL